MWNFRFFTDSGFTSGVFSWLLQIGDTSVLSSGFFRIAVVSLFFAFGLWICEGRLLVKPVGPTRDYHEFMD